MKYLECHDLHVSESNLDITLPVIDRIIAAAKKHRVDFVVTSDLHDKPFVVAQSYSRFLAKMRELLDVCAVAAVWGTPGHETEHTYAPLEHLDLVLLRPGKMYGYGSLGVEVWPINVTAPRCLLFGIPELTKQNIMATLTCGAEEANAAVEDAFRVYVETFIAPMRAAYPDIPAIGVMHGAVTDYSRETELYAKVKHSAIIPRTEDMAIANLTRWSLGHVHYDWESRKINAGYSASWGKSWGETGFVPAMNLVETEDAPLMECRFVTRIERIPYGTPMRMKISKPLPVYDPDIAYWLESDDPDAQRPAGHPWSRVTYSPKRETTQRITAEQAATVTGLSDLFRLFDPSVPASVIAKVDGMAAISRPELPPVDARLDSVEVVGCKFFRGRTAKLDIASLPSGLTDIIGGNGDGKSSLLSFCSLYPIVIGKDTRSGKASAIAQFFSAPDSRIEKHGTINGKHHHHKCTIKGAHTKSPKIEYFLYIDGEKQLEKGTWEEMMAKCEALYGPFDDYYETTFYPQPLQSQKYSKPGIINSSMVDIQGLVNGIARVDRDIEKEHALEQKRNLEAVIKEAETWLAGAAAFAVDTGELETVIADAIAKREALELELVVIEKAGKEQKAEVEKLRVRMQASNDEAARRRVDLDQVATKQAAIAQSKSHIATLEHLVRSIDSNRKLVADDDAREARMRVRQDVANANTTAKLAHDSAMLAWSKRLHETQDSIRNTNRRLDDDYNVALAEYTKRKAASESVIANQKEPCPQCGYQPEDAKARVEEAQADLTALVRPVKPTLAPVPDAIPNKPVAPSYLPVPDMEPATIDRTAILADIEAGTKAEATTAAYIQQVGRLEMGIEELQARTYAIDTWAEPTLDASIAVLEDMQAQEADKRATARAIATTIEADIKRLDDAKAMQLDIATRTEKLATDRADLADWQYVASKLQPSQIPAMELELVIEAIDRTATANLAPWREGRHAFATETQGAGSAGVVDRFDIKIHDNETGESKSFLEHSPGEKAFLNDAYVKALIRVRNERAHRVYSPIISDEADGPIEPDLVGSYYAMQTAFYSQTDAKVLCVSHAPDAHQYIGNHIAIEAVLE